MRNQKYVYIILETSSKYGVVDIKAFTSPVEAKEVFMSNSDNPLCCLVNANTFNKQYSNHFAEIQLLKVKLKKKFDSPKGGYYE